MTDPIAVASRAAAESLAANYDPGLVAEVEAALHARSPVRLPQQYIDLVSVGSLIVSVATLAWTIYNDMRKNTPHPLHEVVIRAVRIELHGQGNDVPVPQEQITEVVVTEIMRVADNSR